MDNTVLLLPHQERFLQSPRNFPDIRWHFLLAGYGAGKTRSLAIAALSLISELDGEKDDGGLYAKIAVAGYTYAHLEQTFLIDFRAYLEASKTPYHEDTKDHIITVGTVQLILLQLSEPGKIFGQSIYCLDGNTRILTRLTNGSITYVRMRDIAVGDTVLTRAGWKPVTDVFVRGRKKVVARAGLVGTPDHKIPVSGGRSVWLRDIYGSAYYGVPARSVRIWEEAGRELARLRRILSTLTESGTTGTRTVRDTIGDVITGARAIRRCIGLYGRKRTGVFQKDAWCITRTATLLTTALRILSACRSLSTARCTGWSTAGASFLRLRARLYAIYAERILRALRGCVDSMSAPSGAGELPGKSWSIISETEDMFRRFRRERAPGMSCAASIVAMCSRLLGMMLDSVLSDVVTHTHGAEDLPPCRSGDITPLPVPYAARRSSPGTRLLDAVRGLALIIAGGTRTVYDISVEGCHEFATDRCFAHNCALADEVDELEEDIMIEAMKSLSQRVRQIMPGHRSPYVMAASTAQGMKGFYRLYSHYKKCGVGFVLVRARTQDNWYLPREYIEDLWKNFTETERKVYMEGEFLTVTQGRVIPNFDWDRNFAPESDMDLHLLPGERVFIGQDFNSGYSRASAWVSRDSCLHCVKYYDFPDVGDAPRVFRYDFPEQDLFWVPDVTGKDQYPHFARDLRKYDVHIIHRAKSPMVEDSCFLLSKLCLQGRLMIHSQASEVADAFATASRDKNNRIPKGVGVSSPIHAIDGARYACSYMALILPEYRDLRQGLMRHLASFRRSLEEDSQAPVKGTGAGYVQIEGTAFL